MKSTAFSLTRFIFLFGTIFHLSSCTDQTSSSLFTYLVNKSGYNIELNYYKNGVVYSGVSADNYYHTTLLNQEEKKVDTSGEEGKSSGSGYARRISSMDSAIVTYDGNRKSVHYPLTKIGANTNGIRFEDVRNLFNDANYQKRILVDNDKKFEAEYTYTFTEKDYLNAK